MEILFDVGTSLIWLIEQLGIVIKHLLEWFGLPISIGAIIVLGIKIIKSFQ